MYREFTGCTATFFYRVYRILPEFFQISISAREIYRVYRVNRNFFYRAVDLQILHREPQNFFSKLKTLFFCRNAKYKIEKI